MLTDVRQIEAILRSIESAENSGTFGDTFCFTVSPKSGGSARAETGKYFFLYSRALDGSWKIARVIVNLDERDDDEPDLSA